MAHELVRSILVPEIIRLICESKKVTEMEAMDMFYGSATGASFADDTTGLYGQSALYIYGLFMEEIKQ